MCIYITYMVYWNLPQEYWLDITVYWGLPRFTSLPKPNSHNNYILPV